MKHTPGPWQHKHLDYLQICDADGEVRGCSPIARVAGGHNGETRAEARANARLIAAAPDLLEALRDTLEALECWTGSDVRIGKARAAIAKATGEQV